MSVERTLSRLDLNLLTTALLIAAIGCLLVYSATYFGPDAPLFRKQVIWTLIGIVLMIIFIALDYHVLMEIAPFLYGLGILLLAYLLVSDRLTRNVKSWIHVGNFQFQPSEFMKIFTALMIAKYFDSNDRAYLDFRTFVIVMAMIGFPVVLIAAQPAFGSAASFFPLFGVAMFFGGIKPKLWLIASLCFVVALPIGWHYLKPFQKERIMIFMDPARDPLGSGYQVMQAKIATGSGGITGKGFLHGTQVNLEYLPARHTDFIFSVLGEEWGFVGVSVVLTLYLFLIVESLSVAKASRDRGGTFLVLSLICFFIFHILINVSMQIGLLPVTGIPLPLISYGGSATMMFFMAIGLILNVGFRRFVNV
ncbi:MAG TPA: rod shape-determining protein RodA [Thermoanaerobaculia bacterium]|jgi:rod shape determining protein RodA|nr:rod shape-determining protein RodA [Thermoanaerobaculia bacterium]